MDPRTKKALATVALLVVAGVVAWLQKREPESPAARSPSPSPTATAEDDTGARPAAGPRQYRPQGPLPEQAIPGGGLEAHEGQGGGHTLARHVGRTLEQLRQRLRDEDKREVSTFSERGSAERLVARVLYEHRRDIQRWLDDGARGDQAYVFRSDEVAGQVLKAGARASVPGHTVLVVLYATGRFPEGFAIRTAYVKLP